MPETTLSSPPDQPEAEPALPSSFAPEDEEGAYSPASLVRNFTAMLDDMNYRPALDILGVGGLQFKRRKLLTREFRALYIGLWRLALMRSFPDDHDRIFHAFMEQETARHPKRREAMEATQIILQYVDKLREHGDTDFSDVSRHILSLLEFDETRTKALILKLALHLRRVYTHFFDHLV